MVWTLLVEENLNSQVYVFTTKKAGEDFIAAIGRLLGETWKPFSGPVASDGEVNYGILREIEVGSHNSRLKRFLKDFDVAESTMDDMEFWTDEENKEIDRIIDVGDKERLADYVEERLLKKMQKD